MPTEPPPCWKTDFPIDWEEDSRVSRRLFTRVCTGASLALFVGNLWLLAKSVLRKKPSYQRLAIARLSDLPVGGSRVVSYPTENDPVLIVRLAADQVVGYSQKCTHLSCAVRYEPSKECLGCPCHRGAFSLEDGAVLAGPPTRPLPKVELVIEGDDVFATGVTPA